MTHRQIPESKVVEAVRDFYLSRKYFVHLEVPNMGRSIDIVAKKGRTVTAIEAKVREWRKALGQCRDHEMVADHIIIAVSVRKISKKFLSECRSRSYGIINCNPSDLSCSVHLRPKKNGNHWPAQRRVFLKNIRARTDVN